MSSNPSASVTAAIYLPLPIGTVIAYMGPPQAVDALAPLGWLDCNGTAYSSKTYPELFKLIGTTYGGDGKPNFNLPQLSGAFLRGVDPGGVVDPDRASRTSPIAGNTTVVGPVVGSRQGWQVQNHLHNWWNNFGLVGASGDDLNLQLCENSPKKGNLPTSPTTMYDGGGAETRPYNVYVFFLIFSGLPQTGQPGGMSAELKTGGGRADAKKRTGAAKGAKKKPASTKKATSAKKARTAKKRK